MSDRESVTMVGSIEAGAVTVDIYFETSIDQGEVCTGYFASAWVRHGAYFCTGGRIPLNCESDCEARAAALHLGEALAVVWGCATASASLGPRALSAEALKASGAMQGAGTVQARFMDGSGTATPPEPSCKA